MSQSQSNDERTVPETGYRLASPRGVGAPTLPSLAQRAHRAPFGAPCRPDLQAIADQLSAALSVAVRPGRVERLCRLLFFNYGARANAADALAQVTAVVRARSDTDLAPGVPEWCVTGSAWAQGPGVIR